MFFEQNELMSDDAEASLFEVAYGAGYVIQTWLLFLFSFSALSLDLKRLWILFVWVLPISYLILLFDFLDNLHQVSYDKTK